MQDWLTRRWGEVKANPAEAFRTLFKEVRAGGSFRLTSISHERMGVASFTPRQMIRTGRSTSLKPRGSDGVSGDLARPVRSGLPPSRTRSDPTRPAIFSGGVMTCEGPVRNPDYIPPVDSDVNTKRSLFWNVSAARLVPDLTNPFAVYHCTVDPIRMPTSIVVSS